MVTAQRMSRKRAHDWVCEETFLDATFGKQHEFRGEHSDLPFQEWSCYIEVAKRPLEDGRRTVKMRPTHGSSKFETYELTVEEIEDVLDAADVPMALRPECCGD
jgi:hypothetical protein